MNIIRSHQVLSESDEDIQNILESNQEVKHYLAETLEILTTLKTESKDPKTLQQLEEAIDFLLKARMLI